MRTERYISVDIEAAGPLVGTHSMLSLGACVVGQPELSFYSELKPIGQDFEPEALKVSGFDMERLSQDGEEPSAAMDRFRSWLEEQRAFGTVVFVGFNGCYDWQFVNWYLLRFGGDNPFGFGGIDIKSYFMGKSGVGWLKSSSSQLPDAYKPDVPQTHNALDDARAQGSIFQKLLDINP